MNTLTEIAKIGVIVYLALGALFVVLYVVGSVKSKDDYEDEDGKPMFGLGAIMVVTAVLVFLMWPLVVKYILEAND